MTPKGLRPTLAPKGPPHGSAPVPHYHRIKAYLLELMDSGTLRFGDQIPTEEQLCEMFRVSRMTARRAVDDLVREGRLFRKQGVGTFVQAPPIRRELSKLTTLTEELRQLGYKNVRSRILVWRVFRSEPTLARLLSVPAGEPVLRVKRIRYAEETPIAVQTIDIPAKYARDLQSADLDKGVYIHELAAERLGGEVEWAKQRIDAVRAATCYAKWLEVEPGSPLFKVTRQTYLSDGRPVDFVRTYYRPDRYSFYVNLYRER